MNFIDKAISHVYRIFPSIYETRSCKGSFHFAFGFSKKKLLAVGVNSPDKVNAKALHFAKKFNLESKRLYPFKHSEEDLIGKLIGMGKLSSSLNIVVLRVNILGELKNSKPCKSCQTILDGFGLNKIYWSNSDGKIETY